MSIVCWCASTHSHAHSHTHTLVLQLYTYVRIYRLTWQCGCKMLASNWTSICHGRRSANCQTPNANCELRTPETTDNRANVRTAYVPTNGRSLLVCLTPNSLLFDPMCTKIPLGSMAVQGKPSHFMPASWPSYRVSCSSMSRGLLEQNSKKEKRE